MAGKPGSVKILIAAEIVSEGEDSLVVRLLNGFGTPITNISRDAVVSFDRLKTTPAAKDHKRTKRIKA